MGRLPKDRSVELLHHSSNAGRDTGRFDKTRELIGSVLTSWSLLDRTEKAFFALRLLFRIALNGLDLIAVGLMGTLGAMTASGLAGTSIQILGVEIPEPTGENVVLLVAAVAVLFMVKGALSILLTRWTATFLARIEIKNSARIASFIFEGTLPKMTERSRPEIQFLIGKSTNAAFSGLMGSATTLIIEGFLFVSIFVLFVIVDWVSALAIGLYFGFLLWLLQRTTGKRYLKAGQNIQVSDVSANGSILEMVDAFREIAVLSKQEFFLEKWIQAKKLEAKTGVGLQTLKLLPRYIGESGLILGALIFTIWQLNRGSLSEGLLSLGIFLAGSYRMMGALLPLQQVWNQLQVSQGWVKSAQDVLLEIASNEQDSASVRGEIPDSGDRWSRDEVEKGGVRISVEKLSFTHQGATSPTLRNINLEVSAGSFVALVGPSGAGKTTMVDLMLGLYSPQRGAVKLDGVDPLEFRHRDPGQVSYVPQKPGLVRGSIATNVALGVPEDEIFEDKVWHSLKLAQLEPYVRSLPDGVYTELGKHSDKLSGGQVQRLGLARAIYTDPRLIVLDEATSALDAGVEASVSEAILSLVPRTTVVVIAHRLSTIQHADSVNFFDKGQILASGTFKEVRKQVPLIEEYIRLMSFDSD